MAALSSSELARQGRVNLQTVRYYERKGLLSRPPRSASGYRQFSSEAAAQLRFILQAKLLGFTLREIKELLSLRSDPETTCADVQHRTQAKAADIEKRIRELQRIRRALNHLAERCTGGGVEACSFLNALESAPDLERMIKPRKR